jgi:hypothetical protein
MPVAVVGADSPAMIIAQRRISVNPPPLCMLLGAGSPEIIIASAKDVSKPAPTLLADLESGLGAGGKKLTLPMPAEVI